MQTILHKNDLSDGINFSSIVAADCEIEFCLAQKDPNGNTTTGITRTQTSQTSLLQTPQFRYLRHPCILVVVIRNLRQGIVIPQTYSRTEGRGLACFPKLLYGIRLVNYHRRGLCP